MGLISDAWDAITGTASSWYDEVLAAARAMRDKAKEMAEELAEEVEEFEDDLQDTWDAGIDRIQEGWADGGLLGGVIHGLGALAAVGIALIGHGIDFGLSVVGTAFGGAIAIAGITMNLFFQVLGSFPLLGGLKKFGEAVKRGSAKFGKDVNTAFDRAGDVAEAVADRGAVFVWALTKRVWCGLRSLAPFLSRAKRVEWQSSNGRIQHIDHFFVLMMENRSFDHLLGFLPGVNGTDPTHHYNKLRIGAPIYAGGHARDSLTFDPPHEYPEVQVQLRDREGILNGGFVQIFEDMMQLHPPTVPESPAQVMYGFRPETLPILSTLAREFAVCDAWHSSLPGPTLPNRLFAMAGTSGGLADSPNEVLFGTGFDFDNGSIFDRLSSACIDWRVYGGDAVPLAITVRGVVEQNLAHQHLLVRLMAQLPFDLALASDDFPKFVWLEPNYGSFWSDFTGGSSQHPLASVSAGEELIKSVYEALRASPIWERSALIITYDEHGGFYDHEIPPAAIPPGDNRWYADLGKSIESRGYPFDQLGFRVPAVVVSPLISPGQVSSVPYDHTSILSTVGNRFGLPDLTPRSAAANRLDDLFDLDTPRHDAPMNLPGAYHA